MDTRTGDIEKWVNKIVEDRRPSALVTGQSLLDAIVILDIHLNQIWLLLWLNGIIFTLSGIIGDLKMKICLS